MSWLGRLLLVTLLYITLPVQADKPVLALVIDDLGYSYDLAKQVISLPGQHSFAIIPDTTYSKKIAAEANQLGHEVILHMPMQSSEAVSIEDIALHDGMDEVELTASVKNMLQDMPFIRGINNHMGSRLTRFDYIMRPVMETIRQTNLDLYFLDSRTTALSTAYQQARLAGIPTIKRDIFLDVDHQNPDSIEQQLNKWLERARNRGYAIAIGHPYPGTLQLLREKIPLLEQEFEFVTISQLLQTRHPRHPEVDSWPKYLSHLRPDLKNSKPSP